MHDIKAVNDDVGQEGRWRSQGGRGPALLRCCRCAPLNRRLAPLARPRQTYYRTPPELPVTYSWCYACYPGDWLLEQPEARHCGARCRRAAPPCLALGRQLARCTRLHLPRCLQACRSACL